MAAAITPERQRALAAVSVEDIDGVRVVSFPPTDRGIASHDAVRAYFSQVFLDHVHDHHRLVLDLTGVAALDSAALGPLVQKLRDVQEHRGRLVLTGVEAPALREIFALTRFDRVFSIVSGRDAALTAARQP